MQAVGRGRGVRRDASHPLMGLLGPLEIKYHHDPMAPGLGAVRCKITGQLNFMFASHLDQGANLWDEERQAIVPQDCR